MGSDVRIGARVRLSPHVVIGDGVTLGDDVRLDAHVAVYDGDPAGSRVWCKAGAVIGGAGFGYALRTPPGTTGFPTSAAASLGTTSRWAPLAASIAASLDDTVIGREPRSTTTCMWRTTCRIGTECLIMAGSRHRRQHQDRRPSDHRGPGRCRRSRGDLGDGATIGGKTGVIGDVPRGSAVFGLSRAAPPRVPPGAGGAVPAGAVRQGPAKR